MRSSGAIGRSHEEAAIQECCSIRSTGTAHFRSHSATCAFESCGASRVISSSRRFGVPERELSYWLEVQKYRNGKPDKEPFRVPGGNDIPSRRPGSLLLH
jgi:hypothetical protein